MKNIVIIIALLFFVSCKNDSHSANKNIKPADTSNVVTDTIEGDFSGGTLLRIDDFPSNFIPPRKVDIWLPFN